MTVCLVHNAYPPFVRGGAEHVVVQIARALRENGKSVFVVTPVSSFRANIAALLRGGWICDEVDGIRVYQVATLNLLPYARLHRLPAPLRLLWHAFDLFAVETRSTVRRILLKERPDVVMTHNLMGLGLLIPALVRSLGIRHVHTLHDVQLAVPSGLLAASGTRGSVILSPLFRWYEAVTRRLFGSPDVVVSPSQWLLDFHTERGFFPTSKKIVLPNPVETKRQETGDKRQDNEFRFLYVGQLEKHKGILFLIETLKGFRIHDSRFTIQLDIVGSGSLLKKVQRMAVGDERITVHGVAPHDQLSRFYANADVLIVPSLVHENTPTVILEAFAQGVPVIASRVGGIPECVEEGKTGWLFEAGDADALLAVLQNVVQEKQKLPEMREGIHGSLYGRGVGEYVERLLALIH